MGSSKEYMKAYRERNKEKLKQQRASYYANNKERELENMRKWKADNAEYVLEYAKQYALENPEKRNATEMRRHAKKVSSSLLEGDEWNDFYIEEIYSLRKFRSDETGFEWHVDHEIPLQGKLVSGLHVWNNLRLIPAKHNLAKNNSFVI